MKKSGRKSNIIAWIVIAALAVLLVPILVVNLTLIVRGNADRDVPPSIFGIAPLAVTSGSMAGDNGDSFDVGALIFVRVLDESQKQELSVGDVVCFRTEGVYVTHRIVSLNGDGSVVTKGDANNATDGSVPRESIFGLCVGSIAGLGNFTMFLQTPVGILVFVGLPVLAFIAFDVIRITRYNRRQGAQAAADREEELRGKDEEIRRLRALVEEQQRDENAETE